MYAKLMIMLVSGILFVGDISACEIVDSKKIHRGMHDGIAGECSNNGRKIECINSGVNQGGITCRGPEGTNSGYQLDDIIYSVCGCRRDDLQEQLDAEME